jgi:ABC-type multidrug transport system permease subunit
LFHFRRQTWQQSVVPVSLKDVLVAFAFVAIQIFMSCSVFSDAFQRHTPGGGPCQGFDSIPLCHHVAPFDREF